MLWQNLGEYCVGCLLPFPSLISVTFTVYDEYYTTPELQSQNMRNRKFLVRASFASGRRHIVSAVIAFSKKKKFKAMSAWFLLDRGFVISDICGDLLVHRTFHEMD